MSAVASRSSRFAIRTHHTLTTNSIDITKACFQFGLILRFSKFLATLFCTVRARFHAGFFSARFDRSHRARRASTRIAPSYFARGANDARCGLPALLVARSSERFVRKGLKSSAKVVRRLHSRSARRAVRSVAMSSRVRCRQRAKRVERRWRARRFDRQETSSSVRLIENFSKKLRFARRRHDTLHAARIARGRTTTPSLRGEASSLQRAESVDVASSKSALGTLIAV